MTKGKSIINQIYDKIHAFGEKNLGKHPVWISLNMEQFLEIKASSDYFQVVGIDIGTGKPKSIMGMHYIIRDVDEIEVK